VADLGRALIFALLLTGCARKTPPPEPPPAPTPNLRAACCTQCKSAASSDPSAMDLSLVPCGDYAGRIVNGAAILDPTCSAWFAESGLMVQDCR
jgi:hypothetical protein